MTDQPDPAQTPAPPAPAAAATSPVSTILLSLVGTLPGLIGGLAGAGWPGVVALVVGGLGLVFGLTALVNKINGMVDSRDQANAGADAGQTAVDLRNQADQNRKDGDDLESQDPPTKP